MSLPPGQFRILSFFADAEENGQQASRAEVAEALGYAFPSAVSKHVEALVRKGYMAADRDRKRNAHLTEQGWALLGRQPRSASGVPVIGAIAAGAPIMAVEHQVARIDDIAPAPGRFALKVRGDSMINAGINDGDYAIIDADQPVSDGQIGAVQIDDQATLKRVRFEARDVVLYPENPSYKPISVNRRRPPDSFRIIGPLRFVYRSFH